MCVDYSGYGIGGIMKAVDKLKSQGRSYAKEEKKCEGGIQSKHKRNISDNKFKIVNLILTVRIDFIQKRIDFQWKLDSTRGQVSIKRNSRKSKPEKSIVTGIVISHAMPIAVSVLVCKFFIPFPDTMVPAIPEDKTCVVLTGNPNMLEIEIVLAAIRLAVTPWA